MFYNIFYELILNNNFVETPMIVGFIDWIIDFKVEIFMVVKIKVSAKIILEAFIHNPTNLIWVMWFLFVKFFKYFSLLIFQHSTCQFQALFHFLFLYFFF